MISPKRSATFPIALVPPLLMDAKLAAGLKHRTVAGRTFGGNNTTCAVGRGSPRISFKAEWAGTQGGYALYGISAWACGDRALQACQTEFQHLTRLGALGLEVELL